MGNLQLQRMAGSREPRHARSVGKVPLAGVAEVNAAIEAAAAAFPDWRRTPPEDRIQPLFKLKMLLEEHLDELSRLITIENAKRSPKPKRNFAAP